MGGSGRREAEVGEMREGRERVHARGEGRVEEGKEEKEEVRGKEMGDKDGRKKEVGGKGRE